MGRMKSSPVYTISVYEYKYILYTYTWNSKEPVLYGCFNWMIQNLYMENGWKKTKHPFKKNWLFRVCICSHWKMFFLDVLLFEISINPVFPIENEVVLPTKK